MAKKRFRGLAVTVVSFGLLIGSAVSAAAAVGVRIDQPMVSVNGIVTATVTSSEPQGLVRCQWTLAGEGIGTVEFSAQQNQATSGWTSQANFTSPIVPLNATNAQGQEARTTTVGIACEQFINNMWQPIGSHAIPIGDTRPQWCQDAQRFLTRGQQIMAGSWIVSSNCNYGLTIQQSDGNVVLYRLNPNLNQITILSVVAATNQFINEFANAPSFLAFQGADGNLVQYLGQLGASTNAVAWTGPSQGQALFVQDDGNVVIYSGGDPTHPTGPVWARSGVGNANSGGQASPTHGGTFTPANFFALNSR
jgi:hypothetical protein